MRVICSLLFSLALLSSTGCETPLGGPSPDFGSSVRAARLRMTANPEASMTNTEPVLGLSAPTAAGVIENYHASEDLTRQRERLDTNTEFEVEY